MQLTGGIDLGYWLYMVEHDYQGRSLTTLSCYYELFKEMVADGHFLDPRKAEVIIVNSDDYVCALNFVHVDPDDMEIKIGQYRMMLKCGAKRRQGSSESAPVQIKESVQAKIGKMKSIKRWIFLEA